MKVLTLIHGFHPVTGGAETAALEVASRAAAAGIEVVVVTAGAKGLPRRESIAGVPVFRSPMPPRSLGPMDPGAMLLFALGAVPMVHRLAREADVLHAHFTIPAGLMAWALSCLRRRPYLVTLHGSDVPGYHHERPHAGLYALTRPLARRVWRGADRVVAVSEELRQFVAAMEGSLPIEVVPNGVDTHRFAPPPDEAREPGRILLVGRLIRLKGHSVFLRALARVHRCWDGPLRAEIIGDGPELEDLRREAAALGVSDRVDFLGFVPHESLPALYARVSLFVMPSLGEALPMAILEAMASGLPVVASRVGGIPDVLPESGALYVPPGDEEALARAILAVLSEPGKARAMGRENRERAAGFHWDVIAMRYVRMYEEIRERARGR